MVWVGQGEKVVPVTLVESSERCEDENGLLIANWVGCCCQIVEMVVDDWWRFRFAE